MIPQAILRQFAHGQEIDLEVADQDVVLLYALNLLNEGGLVGYRQNGSMPGPLHFKGGTALRKCVFGSTGRFSQDIDLDSAEENGFEAKIEDLIHEHAIYHGIRFEIESFRYSEEDNFSGSVHFSHSYGEGGFELQISYRMSLILEGVHLEVIEQPYFARLEFDPPQLFGLDPYEMIAEKIMACNRRVGGSGKDVYDLYLWAARPFSEALVRKVATLKAWQDQRRSPRYDPERFLAMIEPKNFRWEDVEGLVPRGRARDPREICQRVSQRFSFLTDCTPEEQRLLADQVSHRERQLFDAERALARSLRAR